MAKKKKKHYKRVRFFFPLYFQFSVMRRDFARLLILTLGNNATAVKIKSTDLLLGVFIVATNDGN